MRVIVADDHECVRVGVAALLRLSSRMAVVAEAHDTRTLAEQIGRHDCDVVVTDVCMPGMHGEYSSLAMLRRLMGGPRRPAIVVLTMVSCAPILCGLVQLGLKAIVDKRDTPISLIPAIEAASLGVTFLSGHAGAALQCADGWPAPCAGVPSAREWQVIQLYAQGMPIREIATQLARSPKTVSTQKRSAMRKLGLKSERDLAGFTNQIGLT